MSYGFLTIVLIIIGKCPHPPSTALVISDLNVQKSHQAVGPKTPLAILAIH